MPTHVNRCKLEIVAMSLAVAALAVTACGSSTQTTNAAGASSTSASSTSPATGTNRAPGTTTRVPTRPGRGGLSRGHRPGVRPELNNPVVKAAYTKFAACMRENGVDVPPPNTSGKGPVFNSKYLKLSNPTFRAADRKCRSILFEGSRAH